MNYRYWLDQIRHKRMLRRLQNTVNKFEFRDPPPQGAKPDGVTPQPATPSGPSVPPQGEGNKTQRPIFFEERPVMIHHIPASIGAAASVTWTAEGCPHAFVILNRIRRYYQCDQDFTIWCHLARTQGLTGHKLAERLGELGKGCELIIEVLKTYSDELRCPIRAAGDVLRFADIRRDVTW